MLGEHGWERWTIGTHHNGVYTKRGGFRLVTIGTDGSMQADTFLFDS